MKFYVRTFNPFRRYFWVCEYNTFHRMLRCGPLGIVLGVDDRSSPHTKGEKS